MTATVAQLGARALRKLGLGIVPNASRPTDGATYTAAAAVRRVMRNLGVPYAEADRPAPLGTVGPAEIAQRALRSQGINPVANAPDLGSPVPQSEIAIRALRAVGVDPADLTSVGSGRTFTHTAIATEALRKLGIIDADETPARKDQDYAEARALDVHDMLAAFDYVEWSYDLIPGSVAEAYIALTANLMAPAFGRLASQETAVSAQEMIRLQSLSGLLAYSRAVSRVQMVHDAIVAEGLSDWTISTIPSSVADDYVALAAFELAPVHGKPQDMAGHEAARAHIRRIVLSGARGQALALAKVQTSHDQLVLEGVVNWPVTAVPVAHAEDYAMLAGSMLAPTYGQQPQDAFPGVLERLRRAGQMRDMEERATEKLQAAYAEFNAMGVVTWGLDAIPGAALDALVDASTALMSAEPGKPVDAGAFQRLRMLAMAGPAGQALAEQKVRAVHASLVARNKARWTLLNIPTYAEEPYVLLAATLLAPEVPGAEAKPEWAVLAMRDLQQIISVPSNGSRVTVDYF